MGVVHVDADSVANEEAAVRRHLEELEDGLRADLLRKAAQHGRLIAAARSRLWCSVSPRSDGQATARSEASSAAHSPHLTPAYRARHPAPSLTFRVARESTHLFEKYLEGRVDIECEECTAWGALSDLEKVERRQHEGVASPTPTNSSCAYDTSLPFAVPQPDRFLVLMKTSIYHLTESYELKEVALFSRPILACSTAGPDGVLAVVCRTEAALDGVDVLLVDGPRVGLAAEGCVSPLLHGVSSVAHFRCVALLGADHVVVITDRLLVVHRRTGEVQLCDPPGTWRNAAAAVEVAGGLYILTSSYGRMYNTEAGSLWRVGTAGLIEGQGESHPCLLAGRTFPGARTMAHYSPRGADSTGRRYLVIFGEQVSIVDVTEPNRPEGWRCPRPGPLGLLEMEEKQECAMEHVEVAMDVGGWSDARHAGQWGREMVVASRLGARAVTFVPTPGGLEGAVRGLWGLGNPVVGMVHVVLDPSQGGNRPALYILCENRVLWRWVAGGLPPSPVAEIDTNQPFRWDGPAACATQYIAEYQGVLVGNAVPEGVELFVFDPPRGAQVPLGWTETVAEGSLVAMEWVGNALWMGSTSLLRVQPACLEHCKAFPDTELVFDIFDEGEWVSLKDMATCGGLLYVLSATEKECSIHVIDPTVVDYVGRRSGSELVTEWGLREGHRMVGVEVDGKEMLLVAGEELWMVDPHSGVKEAVPLELPLPAGDITVSGSTVYLVLAEGIAVVSLSPLSLHFPLPSITAPHLLIVAPAERQPRGADTSAALQDELAQTKRELRKAREQVDDLLADRDHPRQHMLQQHPERPNPSVVKEKDKLSRSLEEKEKECAALQRKLAEANAKLDRLQSRAWYRGFDPSVPPSPFEGDDTARSTASSIGHHIQGWRRASLGSLRVDYPSPSPTPSVIMQRQGAVGLDINGMMMVVGVRDGSAAKAAGIEAGDVLVSINGVPIASREELLAILASVAVPGEHLTMEVARGGTTRATTVAIPLSAAPPTPTAPSPSAASVYSLPPVRFEYVV